MSITFLNVFRAFKEIIESSSWYDILPSGSGFDAEWSIKIVGSDILLSGSYHLMNELGFYIGWFHFTVRIFETDKKGFDLEYITKSGEIPDEETQEYILDEIYYKIER